MNNNDMSNQTNMGPSGQHMGGSMRYDGANFTMNNGANFNPNQLNASAGKYVDNNTDMMNEFKNSAAGGAFNPHFYDTMKAQSQAHGTTSLENEYAKMGLSGSSAEMGGLNQSIQGNQMSWLNREQSDQMKAMQGMEGINAQGYGQTMGIQNGYNDFEGSYNQSLASLLGVKTGQEDSNNQMWGNMIGAGMKSAAYAAA